MTVEKALAELNSVDALKSLDVESWTIRELRIAIICSGYGAEDILAAKFERFVSGKALFKIKYEHEGETETGVVYVKPEFGGAGHETLVGLRADF